MRANIYLKNVNYQTDCITTYHDSKDSHFIIWSDTKKRLVISYYLPIPKKYIDEQIVCKATIQKFSDLYNDNIASDFLK
jgi:hypothetical protein